MAVSITSAPASTAFRSVMKARPVVQWVWMTRGKLGHRVLDGGDQIIGVLGPHDAGHILDADGLHAHALQVLHHLDVLLQGVTGLVVKQMVPEAWAPCLLVSSMATSRLRTSLRASKSG